MNTELDNDDHSVDLAIRIDKLLSPTLGDTNLASDNPFIRVREKGYKELVVTTTKKLSNRLGLNDSGSIVFILTFIPLCL